jgi:hypothetical protein
MQETLKIIITPLKLFAALVSSSDVLGNLINLGQTSSKNFRTASMTFDRVAPHILKLNVVFVKGRLDPEYLEKRIIVYSGLLI